MASISSMYATTLPIPPSCIEFVPGQREWCVIGTYFLDKGSEEERRGEGQKRSGSLVLARLSGEGEGEGRDITSVSTTPTPFAIFDLHFSPHRTSLIASPSSHLLGLASSTGSIALFAIDPSATAPETQITHLRTLQLFPQTDLVTYFTWHPAVPLIAGAALADGRIVLCDCSGDDDVTDDDAAAKVPKRVKTLTLHTHSLEAWVTAFGPNGDALYSGGDDATLKGVGLPLPSSAGSTSDCDGLSASAYLAALASEAEGDGNGEGNDGEADGPSFTPPWQWQDVRTHGAGVTYILPLPLPVPPLVSNTSTAISSPTSSLLLTGSYDESLRLIAPPPPVGSRRARELAHVPLGGGVWRVGVIDGPTTAAGAGEEGVVVTSWTLLVSCMHSGTKVVRLTGNMAAGEGREQEWTFDVLARFEEHQSMNYASAAQPLPEPEKKENWERGAKKERIVVSTSFYDCLVAVWEWP